jgi:outer membrane protein assembly factor BamB
LVNPSPAVVDGTVFVGSADENVYALDAATGTRQWAFETDDTVFSSPAVVDGTVFVGSLDGNVYALDAATGTRQWAFETDGSVYSSPAVVDGTVFVGSGQNVYALGGDATGAERVGDTEAYDPCPNPTCEVNLSKYRYESEVNFCPVCGTELRAEEGSDTRVYDPR